MPLATIKWKMPVSEALTRKKAKKREAEGKKLRTLHTTKKQVMNLKAVGWSRFKGMPKLVAMLVMKLGMGKVTPPSSWW